MIATLGSVIRQLLAPLVAFSEDVGTALSAVLLFAISLIYGALTEWIWRGQTVGKRLFGLRVVDASIFPKIPGFFIVSSIYIAAEKAADVIHANSETSNCRT